MLTYRRTSLLESTAQTLVNTVNCVGVMGKGIALEFKQRDPKMFAAYKKICADNLLRPGKLWLWRGPHSWVLNFPTKDHWRNPSKLEWIDAGLKKFAENYSDMGIREISFPRLGCGNGGLDWNEVRPLMEAHLSKVQLAIYIHDYTVDIGLPEHLENVANKLSEERPHDSSFEDFVKTVWRAVELAGSELVDLHSKKPITARVDESNNLLVEAEDTSWIFETEDLWGVWIGLQKGLLTKEKAGWSNMGAGSSLLSVLSLMPQIRAIEIQQAGTALPEIAVEFKPARDRGINVPVTAKKGDKRLELSWH